MDWLKRLVNYLITLLDDKIPEPEPDAPLTPQPPKDEVDPSYVIWDEQLNPSKWKVTATITKASMTRTGVYAEYYGTKDWPLIPGKNPKESIGNWWLIARCADGNLHGATIEWLGRGKTRVTGKRWDGLDDIHGAMSYWVPKKGETAYIMISTPARAKPWTIMERSQIVKVIVP